MSLTKVTLDNMTIGTLPFSRIDGAAVNVIDYNVDPTGVSDSTAGLQAAINDASALKKTLYIPAGTYLYTTLTIDDEIFIRGDGNGSVLSTTQTLNGGITVTARWPVTFEQLLLTATGTQTAGALITLNASVFETGLSTFRNVTFLKYYIGLRFLRAATWNIFDCYFEGTGLDAGSTSVWIQNDQNPDSGDSTIMGSVFFYSNNIGTHIRQISSGGTKIIGNKFLFGECHYRMVLAENANTYDLIFANNSSEFAEGGNMVFDAGATASWSNIQISNSQFTITSGQSGILFNDNGYVWADGILINNNIFGSTGASTAIALNYTRRVLIDSNMYRMEAGSSGIDIAGNTQVVDIKPQSFLSCDFPIVGGIDEPDVSIVSAKGVNFELLSGENIQIALDNTLASSVASIVIGGTVQTVGFVTGQYIATGTSTVTTLQSIANVAVTTNGTSITITNNTGQTFNGKVLINY